MPNHQQLQLFSLNGQPMSADSKNQKQCIPKQQGTITSRRSPQKHLKNERWYAGFSCRGNAQDVQNILDLISRKVQEFNLSNLIPLIRVEKGDKKGKKEFYLFVAIESEKPGEFPSQLSNLPCFSHPIKEAKYFTYEQIKGMVGPAHKIAEYTNPIPFQEPSNQQFDPFINPEILEPDRPLNHNLVKLLDWLSAKGYGSWSTFQNICKILEIQNPNQVIRNLKLLGHLETSANGKKWSIAPTALVPLNPENAEDLEFYLCGQQNTILRQKLEQFTVVKPEGQLIAFGLPRWKVTFNDRSSYNQLKKLGENPIHKPGNIALCLADCLPTIEVWQKSLAIVGGIVETKFNWQQYQPENKDFQSCGLPEKTGFYEMRREIKQPYPDHSYFYEADTQTWRKGDWYGLRFLDLYHNKALQPTFRRSASKIENFNLSLQQVVTTTRRSEELQNLLAFRSEIRDLLASCHNHQMDCLKALKYPTHCRHISQLPQLIGNSRFGIT